jgi:hypothetical protein
MSGQLLEHGLHGRSACLGKSYVGDTIRYKDGSNWVTKLVSGTMSSSTNPVIPGSSYLPPVNSMYDFNMPLPITGTVNPAEGQYYESVRTPFRFWNFNTIGSFNNSVYMAIKSTEFTFTQHLVKEYGDNHNNNI